MKELNFDLIVVNGDSFSDGGGVYEQYKFENKTEDYVFKLGWASFLSEKLNIPIINLSMGGTSNKSMINKTIRFLENDKLFYHQDCAKIGKPSYIINNFDSKNYKNILFITQWSYLHRFALYINHKRIPGEYRELSPNMYKGIKDDMNDDVLFEKYKEYADLRFGFVYNEEFNGRNFISDYFLYNTYLSTKKNIVHYNWPFVPFQYDKNDKYQFVLNKIKSYSFKLIDKNCIDLSDLKTVTEETSGAVQDGHYGLNSSKIMADRLIEFIKKDYGI